MAGWVLLLGGLAGCEAYEAPRAEAMGEVALTLRADGDETPAEGSDLRVLAFDASGACVANQSMVPGQSALTLPAGSYRMAALRPVGGLEGLPGAGTLAGVDAESRLSFGEGEAVKAFTLSALEAVEVSASGTTYEADLKPATAAITLRIGNLPADVTCAFTLRGVYASVGLDGTYADEGEIPLELDREQVCFPTAAGAEISYTLTDNGHETSGTIACALRAGERQTLELAWEPPALIVRQVSVKDWESGSTEAGEAN